MTVDHAHSLQERIDDRGANEAYAPVLRILGNAVGQLCADARFIIRIQDDFAAGERPEAFQGQHRKELSTAMLRPPSFVVMTGDVYFQVGI